MKKIPAGEFKARCLAVMDEVSTTRSPVVITKRGRAVVTLIPAEDLPDDFIGRLEGVVRVVGDIESPIEPEQSWSALR